MSGEYRSLMEEGMNIKALRSFNEVLEATADRYAESYGDVDVSFRGPTLHAFPGPAAGQQVSAHSNYHLEGETGWDMDVRVDLIDNPYHIDDIVGPNGTIDLTRYAEALNDFDPEATRTRIAKLSLESNGELLSEEELDRWFSFNQRLKEILEPEEFQTRNHIDYLYFFELEDTRS